MSSGVLHQPVNLPANQPKQFYRGGEAIAALRGGTSSDFGPEDWIASTTTLYGRSDEGLTTLPNGVLLRDAVEADPTGWLGPDHVAKFGADTALLVKLLDAGQRLPVHCHPSNAFASAHLNCRHGKTEAWIVVGTSGADPTVYIGFKDDVPAEVVADWVTTQNTTSMLDSLNPVGVRPGDTVFVPAGVPHAIGEGVFIVELQQPTDFSVTLEWQGFLPNGDVGHLGLGYDVALDCVDRHGWGTRLYQLVRQTSDRWAPSVDLLSLAANPFFQADRLHVEGSFALEPSFAVLIVLEGSGQLGELEVHKGSTVVVPHAAGEIGLTGDLVAIRCRPPVLSEVEEVLP